MQLLFPWLKEIAALLKYSCKRFIKSNYPRCTTIQMEMSWLCIFMQRTRYHLNGFAPTKTSSGNQQLGNGVLLHSLTKGGFVALSQCTQKFAVTDELETVCETILSCRRFLCHVELTPIMPCELTSPWVDAHSGQTGRACAVPPKTFA